MTTPGASGQDLLLPRSCCDLKQSEAEPSKARAAFQLPPIARETEDPQKEDLLMGSIPLLLAQGSLWLTSDNFVFIFFILCVCACVCEPV